MIAPLAVITISEPSPLVIGTVRTSPAAARRRAWSYATARPQPITRPHGSRGDAPTRANHARPAIDLRPGAIDARLTAPPPGHRNRRTDHVALASPSTQLDSSLICRCSGIREDRRSRFDPSPIPAEHAPASPKPTASGPGLPLLMLSHPQGLHDHHHGTRGGRVVMQAAGDKGVHLQGQPGAGPGKTFRGSVRGFVRGPTHASRQHRRLHRRSSGAPRCVTPRRSAAESQLLDRVRDVRAHEPHVPAELDARKHPAPGVVADRRARDVQQLGDLVGRQQLVDPAHRGPPCTPGSVRTGCVSSPEDATGFSR